MQFIDKEEKWLNSFILNSTNRNILLIITQIKV